MVTSDASDPSSQQRDLLRTGQHPHLHPADFVLQQPPTLLLRPGLPLDDQRDEAFSAFKLVVRLEPEARMEERTEGGGGAGAEIYGAR